LTREKVLSAAVRLVDRKGVDALSMRRLAETLGVEAMSLYHHVRDKAELLDGVHETIVASFEPPPLSGDWKRDLAALARGFRDLLRRHPRAIPLFATRPAVGARSLAALDVAMGVLESAGLGAVERVTVFQALLAFVVGQALGQWGVDDAPSEGVTKKELEAWPHLARASGEILRHDPEREFELGLSLFVEGLAAHSRAAPTKRR
jgi:AcrR family transcriptional regulator